MPRFNRQRASGSLCWCPWDASEWRRTLPNPRRPIPRLLECSARVLGADISASHFLHWPLRNPTLRVVIERGGSIASRRVSPALLLAYIRLCIWGHRRLIVVNSSFNSTVYILVVWPQTEFFSAQRLKIPVLRRLTSRPGPGYEHPKNPLTYSTPLTGAKYC